jgi:glutathione S-transferase
MRWPDGRQQGESLDLVKELDARYNEGKLYTPSNVEDCVDAFRNIFPRARPSSRAAFLFQYNGEPLWKSTFEKTLEGAENLLARSSGPFFCGDEISAADIAWAPFLERYRYQLPCLHEGLEPDNPDRYPNLAAWYSAMDQVPAYSCRVKGDAGSWRKVLKMAGFGNAGFPPTIQDNINSRIETVEYDLARKCIDMDLWKAYNLSRSYIASTPHEEAAAVVVRNRRALTKDTVKQITFSSSSYQNSGPWTSLLPPDEKKMDDLLLELVNMLVRAGSSDQLDAWDCSQEAACLAAFLDVSTWFEWLQE